MIYHLKSANNNTNELLDRRTDIHLDRHFVSDRLVGWLVGGWQTGSQDTLFIQIMKCRYLNYKHMVRLVGRSLRKHFPIWVI